MVYIIWILVFLGFCAFTDIKRRNIYLIWCVINGVLGIVVNLVCHGHSHLSLLTGVVIGVGFLLVAVFTKQRLGIGDGIVILTMGVIIGGADSFSITLWAFVLCSIISTAGILVLKLKTNTSLPFIPFLFAGSVITFLLQGV